MNMREELTAPPSRRVVSPSELEVVREVGQHLGAVLGDEDEVLEARAAEAVAVEARLDRDHVAGDEAVMSQPADVRLLVDLEPDAVAGSVEEAVEEHLTLGLVQLRRVAVLVEEVADEAMDLETRDAGPDRAEREVERLPRERVELLELGRRRTDGERAREVGVTGGIAVAREE